METGRLALHSARILCRNQTSKSGVGRDRPHAAATPRNRIKRSHASIATACTGDAVARRQTSPSLGPRSCQGCCRRRGIAIASACGRRGLQAAPLSADYGGTLLGRSTQAPAQRRFWLRAVTVRMITPLIPVARWGWSHADARLSPGDGPPLAPPACRFQPGTWLRRASAGRRIRTACPDFSPWPLCGPLRPASRDYSWFPWRVFHDL